MVFLAMTSRELASPVSHHYQYRHTCYKFKAEKYAYALCFLRLHLYVASVKRQSTQKQNPNWKSQANNLNALCREGLFNDALNQPPTAFDSNAYDSLLRACTDTKSISQVHAHLLITGLDQNIFLGAIVVRMYSVCGSMENSRLVFNKIYKPSVLLWNVMIKGYIRNGFCEEALSLYHQMHRAGIQPNSFTFCLVLKVCVGLSALQKGKEIHGQIVRTGFESDVFVATALLDLYANCNTIEYARQLFDRMAERDVVSWNAMIAGYAQNGRANEALMIFNQMQLTEIKPNSVTMVSALQACARLGDLQQGKWIHDYIIQSSFESNVYVENSLVAMYAKCNSIDTARQLFDKMSQRSVVSWNSMIAGYAQNGRANEALALFHEMQLADMTPDLVTIETVLQACAQLGALQQGKWIHACLLRNGFEVDVFLGTALTDMYAKCGRVEIARQVFDKMSNRDMVSWSAMIAGYSQNGCDNEAFTLFHQMILANVTPDYLTMLSVLQACTQLQSLELGKWTHGYIIRNGFGLDVSVENSLVVMYCQFGNMEIARQLFDKMCKRDVVSWSAMIAGYVQNGCANEALTLFNHMQATEIKPNSVTMVSVLQACAHLGALQQGKWIHGYITQTGFESNVYVENSLVAMYAKFGTMDCSRQLFDTMSERNVVSWNAMIAGYAQNGHANEALTLFHQMHFTDIKPDLVTMVSVLPACAHLAALQQGKWIHGYIIRSGFELDIFVGTALIDMYAKCGSIKLACQLFNKMHERNVVSWNTMIAAYGMHGHGKNALAVFFQMQQAGIKPNHITFVCVLSACSHAGFVDEGWQCFDCMSQNYDIMPTVEHYACMVDLLGRAGHLGEAQDFIERMPLEPDASVWGALLSACRICRNIELGERVAERLFHLEPENVGYYVLLSNIYAAAGRWDDVAKVRKLMKGRKLKKIPGCSLIEVNNRVHAFFVGDISHPQSEKIYATLETLVGQMEAEGYVPNTNFVLHDVEEEVKEHMLGSHSEKLAIAFGLINTSPETPIRITKNLRVCDDCHEATKFISKIAKREITVRDANRFHHFKDGLCSCGDYW